MAGVAAPAPPLTPPLPPPLPPPLDAPLGTDGLEQAELLDVTSCRVWRVGHGGTRSPTHSHLGADGLEQADLLDYLLEGRVGRGGAAGDPDRHLARRQEGRLHLHLPERPPTGVVK